MGKITCVYGEFRRTDKGGIDAFRERCQAEEAPAIWIEKRRKFANLYWDCVSTPRVLDIWINDERRARVEILLLGVYEVVRRRGSELLLSYFCGGIRNISIDFCKPCRYR